MTAKPSPPSKSPTAGNLNKIYLIGPQASGKTTYLLALALLHKSQNPLHRKGLVTVAPDAGATTDLKQEGEVKWEGNTPLEPTKLQSNFSSLPEYKFSIDIGRFQTFNIIFTAKDYGGEFFNELLQHPTPPRLNDYLNNCLINSSGCLLMLPDFIFNPERISNRNDVDSFYVDVLSRLVGEASGKKVIEKLRLAVVMSKCERGELWPSRWEPERDLFEVRLPKTRELLRQRSRIPKANIGFFTLSSFGILAKTKKNSPPDPRPNRYLLPDEDGAVLREKESWNPYGLINPIYWLATGKEWKDPSF